MPRVAAADPQAVKGVTDFIFSAPFLLIGVFVVLLMAVTAALPAHMVSLLRENGLREAWVIAIPASIGVHPGAGAAAAVFL